MNYTLFDEFITLQALLKTLSIIPSGGAIKGFLAEHTVLLNGEKEDRRGRKLRIGDELALPDIGVIIHILAPSEEEKAAHLEDKKEKERVKQLVKHLNQSNKKQGRQNLTSVDKKVDRKPVRFPGT